MEEKKNKMSEETQEVYICKRLRFKNWLRTEKNIYPIATIPSDEKEGFLNWVYVWDNEFDSVMREYYDNELWRITPNENVIKSHMGEHLNNFTDKAINVANSMI